MSTAATDRPPATTAPLPGLLTGARQYWAHHGLATGAELAAFDAPLRLLVDAAAGRGADDIDGLLATVPALLTALAGTPRTGGTPRPIDGGTVHIYRNLAVALAATDALLRGSPPSGRLAALPRKDRRAPLKLGRPLEDDERLLLRLHIHHLAGDDDNLFTATRYVLTEAGAMPGESTVPTVLDLDDAAEPHVFWAPGYRDRVCRLLLLDAWGRGIVTRRVHQLGGPQATSRLAYDGDQRPGGPEATRSAHLSLAKLLAAVGLGQLPDVTPSSIALQAARRAAADHGDGRAFALLGRRTDAQAHRDLRRQGFEPSTDPADVRSFLDGSFPAYLGRTAPDVRRRRGAG